MTSEENIYVTAEGEDVTIKNGTKLHKGDKIEWWFHTELIAFSMDRKTETYGGPNEIFRDRLELDETGSLTIKNISLEHFGEFKLEIIDSKEKTTMKTFTVCGKGEYLLSFTAVNVAVLSYIFFHVFLFLSLIISISCMCRRALSLQCLN